VTYHHILVEIGNREHLTAHHAVLAARALGIAARVHPDAEIMLTIGGYDDDPREIWHIPECVQHITRFVVALLSDIGTPATEAIRQRLSEHSLKWKPL